MRWISKMFGRRYKGKHEGIKQAQALRESLQGQAAEVRKLTHSLRTERDTNHLGQRLRLAMEAKHDPQ